MFYIDRVIAGRYALGGHTREWFFKPKEEQQAEDVPRSEGFWRGGVDRETDRPIRVVTRRSFDTWEKDLRFEALARCVIDLPAPGVVPVLHVGPGVVFAAPRPRADRPRLTLAEAAECALAVCEALAHLHAAGVAGDDLSFGSAHLWLADGGDRPISWTVPGITMRGMIRDDLAHASAIERRRSSAIERDLQRTVAFFSALLIHRRVSRTSASGAVLTRRAAANDGEARAALATLACVQTDERSPVQHVAGLARLLVPLAASPTTWAARIDEWPVVPALPAPPCHHDAMIREGEAFLAAPPQEFRSRLDHVRMPLAAACHQRAGQAFARRDLDAALVDVDRALRHDDFAAYHTTRAVILMALGRLTDAHTAIDAAFARPPLAGPDPLRRSPTLQQREVARAHATRGTIALRRGCLADAVLDLRRALELEPTAAHAHALGAALYARGDLRAAAEAETRSLALPGACARHRWALVITLLKLGRREQARTHAQAIVDAEPDVAAHRERLARLFG